MLLSIEAQFARLKLMKARDFFELDAKQNSWAHAYLIIGKNDEEKEGLLNYIIKKKQCLSVDISTVIPEELSGKKGEIKVDQIKRLLHEINLSPLGSCRIAIIHNCERLNLASGNILLKTLEEPPAHLIFILLAENNSVLPTIKSRCRIILMPGESDSDEKNSYAKILEKDFFAASKEIEIIVKNNEIEVFLNELEKYFRKRMLKEKSTFLIEHIRSIEKRRKDIQNNINPRLALESLYLILKEAK